MGTLKLSNGSTDKTQELANTSNKQLYYSYEKLGLSEIDFSVASSNKTTFRNYLDNSYISMYQKNLALILLIGIPYILISGILSLLVEVLVLALLIKILYGRFNVHFGAICKIVIFFCGSLANVFLVCFTPGESVSKSRERKQFSIRAASKEAAPMPSTITRSTCLRNPHHTGRCRSGPPSVPRYKGPCWFHRSRGCRRRPHGAGSEQSHIVPDALSHRWR